mmetsp:Transcript_124376/g.359633  ORF Transcript_124376/g.359633 Transcript_124376/m.359633 type:complete len:125 (+) Transcript_124376:50-424(+)
MRASIALGWNGAAMTLHGFRFILFGAFAAGLGFNFGARCADGVPVMKPTEGIRATSFSASFSDAAFALQAPDHVVATLVVSRSGGAGSSTSEVGHAQRTATWVSSASRWTLRASRHWSSTASSI